MDMRKFKKHYVQPWCYNCNIDMWQETAEERERHVKHD